MKGKNNSNKNLINNCSSKGPSSKKKQNSEKKKKVTVKNTLANPFTLDWPSINYKDFTDIKLLLQNSLIGISKDFECYQTEKKLKRKEFYAAKLIKKESDKVCLSKNTGTNISTAKERNSSTGLIISHESLVFGYNAVMRGLEKGSVISVLVNSKAKPDLIVKMFIPICSVKSIPVIPIGDLTGIVKDAAIGLNSCLALGLKKTVTLEVNIFHKLYIKTCEALGLDAFPSNVLQENNHLVKESFGISSKPAKDDDKKPLKLSASQISSFHLYRINVKERIFKPNELEGNDSYCSNNFLNFDSEFIKFGDNSELKENKTEGKKWQKSKTKTKISLDASKLPSTSMFTIEATGDSPDRNEIKNYQSETKDITLPKISDIVKEFTKESLAVDSSIYDSDNKSLMNKLKPETSPPAFLECTGDNDSTENFNSSSGSCSKRQKICHSAVESSDSSEVTNSASARPLMTNKKKRPFEEFCYVPTKVKRIKSNCNRKSAKK